MTRGYWSGASCPNVPGPAFLELREERLLAGLPAERVSAWLERESLLGGAPVETRGELLDREATSDRLRLRYRLPARGAIAELETWRGSRGEILGHSDVIEGRRVSCWFAATFAEARGAGQSALVQEVAYRSSSPWVRWFGPLFNIGLRREFHRKFARLVASARSGVDSVERPAGPERG